MKHWHRRRAVAWAVAAAAVAAGCGGPGGGPRPSAVGPGAGAGGGQDAGAAAAAAFDPFGPRPPVATPGETMSYRLALRGVEIATFSIAVGEVTDAEGRRVLAVESGVATAGLAALFTKVQDRFETWMDVATARPVRFRSEELSSAAEPIPETADVDFAGATAAAVQVRVGRPDVPEQLEQQVASGAPLFCVNSFLLALRGWDGAAGDTATVDVMRSRYMWRAQVTLAAFESVVTDLGELPAMRIDGVSRRINRDGSDDTSIGERRFSLWISDDADRVPVRMVARTDFGDVEMAIVGYGAGRGPSLRP